MKAIVKTKSNAYNANGKELRVVELLGNIISCKVENGFGLLVTADFNVATELVSLKND